MSSKHDLVLRRKGLELDAMDRLKSSSHEDD